MRVALVFNSLMNMKFANYYQNENFYFVNDNFVIVLVSRLHPGDASNAGNDSDAVMEWSYLHVAQTLNHLLVLVQDCWQ